MRVKSFTVFADQELDEAMVYLDDCVAKLGDIKIHILTDTLYESTNRPRVVRVVVYE